MEEEPIEISDVSDLPDQEVADEETLQNDPNDDLTYQNMQKEMEKFKVTANISTLVSQEASKSSEKRSDVFIRNFLLTFNMKKTLHYFEKSCSKRKHRDKSMRLK